MSRYPSTSKRDVWVLFFLVELARALVLTVPAPSGAFSALVANGSALATWNAETGDPDRISLLIQNIVSLSSFNFASNVAVTDGQVPGTLQDIPAG